MPTPTVPRKHPGPYRPTRCGDPPPPLLRQGIAQFNRGEYFAQHETLEALWRAEPDDVRYLYQGILLIGVGLYHLERGNYHGAVSKLRRGIALLRWFPPVCQGVAVAELVASAERCLAQVERLGPTGLRAFDWRERPVVRLVES